MVEHGDIRVVHCGGSKINFRDPVITHDSRFLLCASGEAVKVFSTSTEECIHELRGHTELVTGVLLRPSNHLQARKQKRFQLVAAHLPQSGDQLVEVQELSAVLSGVSPNPAAIAFGRGGEFIASVNDLQLEVYFFKKQKSYRFFLKEDNKKGGWNTFTCVACHPKDDCIATGHEDGKIRLCIEITIIQSCVKVSAVIQGLVKGDSIRTDLMMDPRSKALVLNGKPGHLQFYSLQRDKLLYNLDIVQQEYIHESGLQQFEVVKAAFDASGSWLATVEERHQKAAELELNLKLWAFDEQTQSFVLNTTISAPHDAQITAMCFCQAADSQTTLLVSTRPFFPSISDLCFGRLSCSKYLLGTTASNLLCWNLLTCSLEWTTSMDVRRLLADPLSENMAAFCYQSGSTDLFVFKPSEPRPLFSHKAVCSRKVTQAVFAPREEMLESCEESSQWLNRSQLYFLTQQMDLMTFTTKAEEDRLLASSKQLVIDDSVAMTPFYLLLGKHRQQQQEHQDSDSSLWAERTALPQTSASIKELLQTPAHVLPSTSYLCSMFVQSLLISVSDAREEKARAEEEMESEKEEEDSEEEMESSRSKPELAAATESDAPALTKAQARELRRVRKLDHSWLAGLLDS
ncbi:WD repeat-containing protein 75 [Neolamprologus brichardi]|uniref:WD repeat-containing protein 75 n=1 Tax=Neolamprologus brichardi TaxID=32507 RepID=UPI001643AE24|nr:WD repeat-containing protein 75 [Neolamprologus brichardi]